jgi:hypothetical protein
MVVHDSNPGPRDLRKEDLKFEASSGYTARPYQKEKERKKGEGGRKSGKKRGRKEGKEGRRRGEGGTFLDKSQIR